MPNYRLSPLSCAALLIACQPVTPTPTKTDLYSPKLKIHHDAPTPPVSMAPPAPSVPAKKLSLAPIDQNKNQTQIDLAISTVTRSSEAPTNSAQASPAIKPKKAVMPKTFDPTKIIGFATPVLVQNLGGADMVRKEGPIEVWQYQFESCVVDFFFYPIVEGSPQLVLKVWDMRSKIMKVRLDRGTCSDEINLYYQKYSLNS